MRRVLSTIRWPIISACVGLSYLLTTSSLAQTPHAGAGQALQVVTKVVEKTIPCPAGMTQRIRITARKADVTVKGWDRPLVSVKLRLLAKHTDRAVAEREVAYHQYTLQPNGASIDLSNGFVIPQRAGRLQSQMKAIYEVNVPNRADLIINDSFGDITLRELSGETSVKIEFGKLTLTDIQGKLTVKSDYGDLEGKSLNAQFVCTAEKATIILRDHGGTSRIQSHYGKLSIFPSPSTLEELNVEAEHTQVTLSPPKIDDFSYDLQTIYGQLFLPPVWSEQFPRRRKEQQHILYQTTLRKPLIKVVNKSSPIYLFTTADVNVGSK